MSLGKDGAIVSNGVESISFDTLASDVVDTTGAGDAFWSGFYAAIIKEYSIKQSLNYLPLAYIRCTTLGYLQGKMIMIM